MSLFTIMTKSGKHNKTKTFKRTNKQKVLGRRRMRGGYHSRKNFSFSSASDDMFSDNNSFNSNPYVRESHNCYMYFLNKKNHEVIELCKKDYPKYKLCRRAQPGYVSGFPLLQKNDYKCSKIMKRTLMDNPNIYRSGENTKCVPSHYKGALVVAPYRDYHYYRKNDDGQWSHKPGYKPSTNFDSKNNLIVNPRKAARDYGGTLNYKDFCGYLCVPRNEKKKRMTHWNFEHKGGKSKKHREKHQKNTKKHKKQKNKKTKQTQTNHKQNTNKKRLNNKS